MTNNLFYCKLSKDAKFYKLFSQSNENIKSVCKFIIFIYLNKYYDLLWNHSLNTILGEEDDKKLLYHFLNTFTIEHIKKQITTNNIYTETFATFYFDMIKGMFKCEKETICNVIEQNNLTPNKKIKKISELIPEYLNIHYLELEGIDIACHILSDNYDIQCPYTDNELLKIETNNIINLYLVPEYFKKEETIKILVKAFEKYIKHPDKILFIVDFRILNERIKNLNINLEPIKYIKELKNIFPNIILYKPEIQLYENYLDINNFKIINDCKKLKQIINIHSKEHKKIACSNNYVFLNKKDNDNDEEK